MTDSYDEVDQRDIAIIGMAGRFPGARTLDAFWDMLKNGREAVRFFSDEELKAAGVTPEVVGDPNYIKAGTLIEDVECFDAAFFGYTPREAEMLDPQQRFFLECAWHALEDAGYVPATFDGAIGVYAGVAWNTYLLSNLTTHPELFESAQAFQTFITNDKDFMPTRVSYKLNLKGPSIIIQTSCSTSLVATHMACMSLLDYDCDIALVGGVTIKVPQAAGYYYQEGGLPSPDGHCRAFDARAEGTIFGNGVGVVALKRLQEALDDGDTIHAVIKGTAINNDGSLKVSYTAPSVDGQAEVIAAAQAVARVEPETISYIEAHGTGTALGDPIEIAALTKVFRDSTEAKQFCGIGSVKTNIGHLDAAAGVAGLLKTVLALKHQQIPPSLHYETPNPKIDFANSPFYVNAKLTDWTTQDAPRRAGISSFGVGGTNAHVIVEEAPELERSSPHARSRHVLVLSAKSSTALDTATNNLAHYLQANPAVNPADVAYTLQIGRSAFNHRRMVVCSDPADALIALTEEPQRIFSEVLTHDTRPAIFMFPGQGAQYVGMGRDLYTSERVFRETVDRCCALLRPQLGLDLRAVLYPNGAAGTATEQLTQTALAQPALFVIEYALAQLWLSWGIQPQAMIGHSIGEYVAACLAGVFSLEDALALVATRGRLMQTLPTGAMLAVPLAEAELIPLLTTGIDLAAVNGPAQCVVSGPTEAIEALEARLAAQEITCRRLHTSHAFHSAMLDPMLEPFAAAVRRVRLQVPRLPYISNLSGTWITPQEATDPRYWVRQVREPVRFASGLATILDDPKRVLLEVGPGTTLSTFARRQPTTPTVYGSLRHPQDQQDDGLFVLNVLGKLWLSGVVVEWQQLYPNERRRRISLPLYPFDRQRYWIAAQPRGLVVEQRKTGLDKQPNIADWFYLPTWKRSIPPRPFQASQLADQRRSWLVFADSCGVGVGIAERLKQAGQIVTIVAQGAAFSERESGDYTLNPRQQSDYDALCNALQAGASVPDVVVHCWSTEPGAEQQTPIERFEDAQARGFGSLLYLVQSFDKLEAVTPLRIEVVTNTMQQIAGEATLNPEQATVLGACKVIPQEYPRIACRNIDLVLPAESAQLTQQIEHVLAEISADSADKIVAYRHQQRWTQSFEPIQLAAQANAALRLRPNGMYLLTGGLSGTGFAIAEQIAALVPATLVFVVDEPFPPRDDWSSLDDQPDVIRRGIERLQRLEQHGATVQVVTAQLSDEQQMRAVVATLTAQHGALHGVIHAAGVVGDQIFRSIQETDAEAAGQHFASKVHGLLVLDTVLRDQPLELWLLVSSLASVLGGRGYAAYTASNVFLDTFAQQQSMTNPGAWISVNWDAWQLEDESERLSALSSNLAQLAITPAEGREALRRILALSPVEQVVVSTGDLQARITQWIQTRSQVDGHDGTPAALHPRPKLQNAYVAPSGELERQIAAIWQKALGFEQVGIHDNFFELGGDSFIAIQVVTQLKKTLNKDIPAVKLYQSLTIHALAEVLAQDGDQAAQRRAAQLEERKEIMDRRKQFQQMRRSRK
jgi:acyl transferase domain-containing protein